MKVFCVPDLHLPFVSAPALAKVIKLIKAHKPDAVVQLGDLLDMYAFSKFPRSQNVATPRQELRKGIVQARKFWSDVRAAAPKARCYQLLGNHDARLSKRIYEKFPEVESLVKPGRLYKFPGVTTLKSDRDHLEMEDVVYCHGWLGRTLDHANHFGKPTVHGHRHRPAIETKGRLWSMDCGHLADPASLPLSYGPSKVNPWRHACGIVEDGFPRLILL